MATPINAKTATEATTEHVRGLNERIDKFIVEVFNRDP